MHVIGQQSTVHGTYLADHRGELFAEVIGEVIPGPSAKEAVGFRAQRIQPHSLLLRDSGDVNGVLRIGFPKLGDEPAMVGVIRTPRPEFRQYPAITAGTAVLAARVSELPPLYRTYGRLGLERLERQSQIHVDPVLPDLANELPYRVVGKGRPIRRRVFGIALDGAVHAVVVGQGDGEPNPVHVQALEPLDVVGGNEWPGAVGFPCREDLFVGSPVPRGMNRAERKAHGRRPGRGRRRSGSLGCGDGGGRGRCRCPELRHLRPRRAAPAPPPEAVRPPAPSSTGTRRE